MREALQTVFGTLLAGALLSILVLGCAHMGGHEKSGAGVRWLDGVGRR